MPALTDTASEETKCISCMNDLDAMALKCKNCHTFTHLSCSKLPDYVLVRLLSTQNSYSCCKCVRTKELTEVKYEEDLMKVQELLAKEQSIITQMNDELNRSASNENHDSSSSAPQNGNVSIGSEASRTAPPTVNSQGPSQINRNVRTPPICKFYEMRECKHGRSGKDCNFSHPKICPNFSRNGDRRGGCTKDKNCKDFHPKVCHESMERKECSRRKCRFYHLNGTKHTYNDEEVLMSRLNPTFRDDRRIHSDPPRRILQRNSQYQQRQTDNREEDINGGFVCSDRTSANFLLMEKKIERIENMLGAVLQSIRPPNLTPRLPDL